MRGKNRPVESRLDILAKVLLVVFDRQHEITAAHGDLLGDRFLTKDRIAGDDPPLELDLVQELECVRYGFVPAKVRLAT